VSTGVGAVMIDATDRPSSDPEVSVRAKRRRFTAEYKLEIVRAAEAARDPGEIGALLRRVRVAMHQPNVFELTCARILRETDEQQPATAGRQLRARWP